MEAAFGLVGKDYILLAADGSTYTSWNCLVSLEQSKIFYNAHPSCLFERRIALQLHFSIHENSAWS